MPSLFGLHDLVLALEHLREVELQALHLDAVLGEVVAGLLEVLGGLQQRLGRDAADVGAGAAERRLAVGVFHSSMQAVFRPSCAARIAAM